MAQEPSIQQLPELIRALPAGERSLFQGLFRVDVALGRLNPPPSMEPWIEKQFGSLAQVREQRVIRVTNLVTLEGAIFNGLRALRPLRRDQTLTPPEFEPLDDPYNLTPEDTFGRLEGRYCITASNVAKFEGFHGLIIFKERDPLAFHREAIHDYIDTGQRWAQAAHAQDPAAKYYLFLWNCLYWAGASIYHGHAQVMLGRGMHYPQVEHLRRSALAYRERTGRNYFQDLYRAHAALGCAFEKEGVQVLAHLAPKKENEVLLMAPAMGPALKDRIYEVLACYRDRLGVAAFNLVICQPPIGPCDEEWEGFPVLVRLVDRGAGSRTNDFGAMEIYAISGVASDPLHLARVLREALLGGEERWQR